MKLFLWKYWGLLCFGILALIRLPDEGDNYFKGDAFGILLFLLFLCIIPVLQNRFRNTRVLTAEKRYAFVVLNLGAILLWLVEFGEEWTTRWKPEWEFGLFGVVSLALPAITWYLWLLWTKD